jgi:predicted PolB exonuclease-like 3'-5' exonuclease
MLDTVVVFDLETNLDIAAYARANGLAECDREAVLKSLGESFAKPMFHQIACIGAVRAMSEGGSWKIEALGAPHRGQRSERDLINAFVQSVAIHKPKLVTYNGGSFDLPVLRWRAMLHEVSAPGLSGRKYFARYLDDSVDLCDLLTSFDNRGKVSLDAVCRTFGWPGKPDGIDGSKVQEFVEAGRFDEVAAYCERDVTLTYMLWLRYELFCGRLTPETHRASMENLSRYLSACSQAKPLLQSLC